MRIVKLLAATVAVAAGAMVTIDFIDPYEIKKKVMNWFELGY